jgi:hypothetical protein
MMTLARLTRLARSPAVVLGLVVLAPSVGRPQGAPLGPEFRVNAYTTGYQLVPALAAAAAGDFVVVWTGGADQDGSTYGVFGQRYAAAGAPLGGEFRVNTYTTGYQFAAKVAVDPIGDFVIIWTSLGQDGSLHGIYGQRYAGSGGLLGPEFRVNTYTTGKQLNDDVASDAAGNFVVVWGSEGQDGSQYGVFGQRYAPTVAPLGTEFRVNRYTTGTQLRPRVAADDAGDFVVVWQSSAQDGSGRGVFGQRYSSAGAALGTEFRVNTATTADQAYPAVAGHAACGFLGAWQSPDGSDLGLFGQRYASSGAPAGPEFRVNGLTGAFQGYPSLGEDASGNFVVAWQDFQEASSGGVHGQRFDSAGAALGPEFRVNTYTTSFQYAAAVKAAAGNFVVVWMSAYEDGSTSGIFGQRYGPIVPVELMRFGVE